MKTVKEASALCRSFLDGVVIFWRTDRPTDLGIKAPSQSLKIVLSFVFMKFRVKRLNSGICELTKDFFSGGGEWCIGVPYPAKLRSSHEVSHESY